MPPKRRTGGSSCPPGDLISHLPCIEVETPANSDQLLERQWRSRSPPQETPEWRRCPSAVATLATVSLVREDGGSDEMKSFLFPSVAPSHLVALRAKHNALWTWGRGWYPDSCWWNHSRQAFIFPAIPSVCHEGNLRSKNTERHQEC